MSGKLAIMAGLAVVFGSTSYYAGNQYLENQAQARMDQLGASSDSAINVTSIVVAVKPLVFGEKITADKLKLVSWPKDSTPEGSYTSIKEAVGSGDRKAIKSIETNEPVSTVKLTGKNGRAGLAGIIAEGMRAVTIPVDNVKGVGGFVMPGDRVDIVFTQRDRKSGQQTAKIMMEKVKVLSVDQRAGSRSDGPKVAKTVTLETDTKGAQRLALASDVGRLSLLLRSAGDEAISEGENTISFSGNNFSAANEESEAPEGDQGFLSFLNNDKPKSQTTIKIVRGEEVKEETVPVLDQIKKKKIQ